MKNPNGYGTVRKLSGTRRRPLMALSPEQYAPGETEKRSSVIGYYATRAEAMLALAEWHKTAPSFYVSNMDITLDQLYNEFKKIKFPTISPDTQESYTTAWKWFSDLRHVKVKNIRSGHLQDVVNKAAAVGRSHSSLHKIKVLAGLLEDYAMQNDIIDKNYAQFIILPKSAYKEKDCFSDLDLQKIESAAKDGIAYADVLLIMCYTGWRITELLELTPFAYDEKSQTLTGGNKTEAGKNRVVPVHPKIQPYLKKWRDMNGGRIICRSKEVCLDGDKQTVQLPMTANYFRKYWYYPTLEALGIPMLSPHATRHTFVSLLHKAGADKWDIQRLAGHASEEVTNKIYTHVGLDHLKDAINMLK